MNEFVEPAVDVALASSWQGFLPATMAQIAHVLIPLQLPLFVERFMRYCTVMFCFRTPLLDSCDNLFLERFPAEPQLHRIFKDAFETSTIQILPQALFLQRVTDLTHFRPTTAYRTLDRSS